MPWHTGRARHSRCLAGVFFSVHEANAARTLRTALLILLLALTAGSLFFFATTRGALLVRAVSGRPRTRESHVYPIYSNMHLIKLVDHQPVISAILLFQYERLVSRIVADLRATDLRGRGVLITSCAFGNVIPACVAAAVRAGAGRVVISDIIANELVHARSKIAPPSGCAIDYVRQDATDMKLAEGCAHVNIMFFLLHELPHPLKLKALSEAGRMLSSGGKLYLAEFHRPHVLPLRCMSWTYFKVFEPLGLALWDSHDPVALLEQAGGWAIERQTFFFGNFQVIVATRI